MRVGHIEGAREIVEREERENPNKASSSYDYQLLPDLAACTAFALVEGRDKRLW
jgi:hypothetical protein